MCFRTRVIYNSRIGKFSILESDDIVITQVPIRTRTYKTRGQRPNESQKAVIIDMIKSVGEIASKMWPVV